MSDVGHDETEDILREIEKRISKEFKQAEKEVEAKLDDYLRRFQIKDELKRRALAAGEITQTEYNQWRVGQIMIGKRWDEMRDALATDFTNADQIARSIAFGYMPEVYALNHNYGTFQVERAARVNTSYTMYNRQAIERLAMDDDGHFIPKPGRVLSERINAGKTMAWNEKNVQSAMMQGILQGESLPKIATRLANTVGEQNRKVAIRNARTMTTGIENAGRLDSYNRAKSMGINMKKQWLATLDNRTRHWHRDLDGVAVDTEEPFENEYGEIMYPGDPDADPANIYNCRCAMIASLAGFERDWSDRYDADINGMTYEEWKESRESVSNPITAQEEYGQAMANAYNAEYAHYATLPELDAMGNVSVMHIPESDSDVRLHQVGDSTIYTQTHSANAQKMAETVSEMTEKYGSPSQTVIVKNATLGGLSGYDHERDILYISEELSDPSWFSQNVNSSFFAAKSLEDVFVHELDGHRNHWLAVQRYYDAGNYDSLESAKIAKETDLRKYVKRQLSNDPLYVSKTVSQNAYNGFVTRNNLNELVADGIVLGDEVGDKELLRLIRQVME